MANEVGKGGEEGEDQVEEIGREQVKRSCLVVVSILHAQNLVLHSSTHILAYSL